MSLGWICPKCNRSVNPNLNHCDCDNGQYTPFRPFTPNKPYNPIEEIKKVIVTTGDTTETITTNPNRLYTIIY